MGPGAGGRARRQAAGARGGRRAVRRRNQLAGRSRPLGRRRGPLARHRRRAGARAGRSGAPHAGGVAPVRAGRRGRRAGRRERGACAHRTRPLRQAQDRHDPLPARHLHRLGRAALWPGRTGAQQFPAALAEFGRARARVRPRPARAARPAPAPGAGAPGSHLREVRAGAVDPPRPAAGGRGGRTGATAGPGAAVRLRDRDGHDRARVPPAGRFHLRELRARAGGQRVDRAGPLRHPQGPQGAGARRGREGAAPGHAARHRERPEPDAHDGGMGRAPVGRRPAPEAARSGGRIRQVPARRAGPGARGRQRRATAPQHGGAEPGADPRDDLGLLPPRGHRDGAHGRRADQPGRAGCAKPAWTSRSSRATA